MGPLLHGGGLAVLVGAGLVVHGLVLSSIRQRAEECANRSLVLGKVVRNAGSIRRDQERLTRELTQIELRAETVRQRIPDQPSEGEFLRQVTQAANREGFVIQDYKRGQRTTGERHSQFEVNLTCEGSYAGLCGFLDRLATLPRISTVTKMQVTAEEQQTVYAIELTLLIYFGTQRAVGATGGQVSG